MKGRLSEISLVGLVKMFYDGRQSGRLKLSTADGEAELYFVDGELQNLGVNGVFSADGPYDIFLWGDGEFEFNLGVATPARNVDLPTARFIERAEEYERRWRSFAKFAFGPTTLVRRTDAEATGVEPEREAAPIMAALRQATQGLPLISLARRSGLGLLATAEVLTRLHEGGLVTFESQKARYIRAAVQDFLNALLRNYEIFAGKVLSKKLIGRIREYAAQLGLPVTYGAGGVTVEATAAAEQMSGSWRLLLEFTVAEMSGPVGAEIARLLWEKALASVEPATADIISLYGSEVIGYGEGGESREKR
jgi:hypothetical protein